jgi:small subunit ribosomal protein S5
MYKKGKAPIREQKEFDEEVIQIDRVTRVVKGGRRLRFRATVAIGNRKGKVGVGIGKSTEVTGAIQKAISQAKKKLVTVPIVGQTIPHRIQVKFKSAKLLMMPACPGTGIIAGGPLRKIIELSGVKDILSKALGNNNRVTNSQAAIIALSRLKEIPWIKKKEEAKKVPVVITKENVKAVNNPAEKAKKTQPTKAAETPVVKQ